MCYKKHTAHIIAADMSDNSITDVKIATHTYTRMPITIRGISMRKLGAKV